jgi:Polyketide cyclase / dehydrase and lipid transport
MVVAATVLGSLLPKRHLASRSATYRATPEQIYALIAGPQNWRPDLLRSEAVPDVNGRELVRETTRDGKTVTYEVLDRIPNRSIRRRIITPNLPYSGTWTYSLDARGQDTTLRISEDGEVYNPVFRFVSRFVLGHTHTIDSYLRALGKSMGQEIAPKQVT